MKNNDAVRLLREALTRLMACAGDITATSEDDLCYAANDMHETAEVREQAAAFLQCMAALRDTANIQAAEDSTPAYTLGVVVQRKSVAQLVDETISNPDHVSGEWMPNTPGVAGEAPIHVNPTHEVADAFWAHWKSTGETGKHGYYESTWGAINAALRMSATATTDIQEIQPVAWLHNDPERHDVIHDVVKSLWLQAKPQHVEHYSIALYTKAEASGAANTFFGHYYNAKLNDITAQAALKGKGS